MLLYRVVDTINISTDLDTSIKSPRIRYFLAHSPPNLKDLNLASLDHKIEELFPVITDLLDKVEES